MATKSIRRSAAGPVCHPWREEHSVWSREGDPATKPVSRGAVLLRHSHRNRIARGPIDRHLYRKVVSRRCVARDYGVDLPDAH